MSAEERPLASTRVDSCQMSFRSRYTGLSLKQTLLLLKIPWDFIQSDFLTFAIPNSLFGIFGAIASPILLEASSTPTPSAEVLLTRLPFILGFNVINLLVFDLANQRAPHSVIEDRINKPWRPIPQGKISPDQTRRMMLVIVPITLAVNYVLGVWQHGLLIQVLTWVYNDLQGGDEAFIREILIAISYGLANSGSLTVAVGPEASLSPVGLSWTVIISGVILTTMQVQDLKDQRGDKTRGRRTIALILGERFSRISIAFFICFWTVFCSYFWAISCLVFILVATVGSVVVVRLLVCASDDSARTWHWWCFWHAFLYTLPVFALFNEH